MNVVDNLTIAASNLSVSLQSQSGNETDMIVSTPSNVQQYKRTLLSTQPNTELLKPTWQIVVVMVNHTLR